MKQVTNLFKGFQFCSSLCCSRSKYCERHHVMLNQCCVCEAVCCNRANPVGHRNSLMCAKCISALD